MNTIKYKIEFFSNWHCSSGLSAGAEIDTLVIKDKDNLPYVPGKTLKGLITEAVEDIMSFTNNSDASELIQAFGYFDDKDKCKKGDAFFTNAELDNNTRKTILEHHASQFLYKTIASTSIDDNGIAKDGSLRTMEVVVPCELYGEIKDISDSILPFVVKCLGMIKRLGLNRNRGLGRCKISIIE